MPAIRSRLQADEPTEIKRVDRLGQVKIETRLGGAFHIDDQLMMAGVQHRPGNLDGP